jgi:1-acyl-sn-glycerol-3-phosphate acyltransferase
MSVLFFPEGTRSPSGELGAFKGGAFKLATQTHVSVVPIAVSGTRQLLVKGSWRFRSGRQEVRVRVLAPLAPTEAAESLRDHARAAIAAALNQAKA